MTRKRTLCVAVLAAAVSLVAGMARADDGTVSLSFDDVKLDMKDGQAYDASLLTDEVKKLDGKSVSIRGFVSPSFKQDGITEFVLMRNTSCRFGRDAPHHFVRVKLAEGESIRYSLRPITVVGDFMLDEFKIGKKVFSIYRMKSGTVE